MIIQVSTYAYVPHLFNYSNNQIISRLFNKNKSQNFLLHPKKKFIYQARNIVKISGVCTTQEGVIPNNIFLKIGKRKINCKLRDGNQFWFKFRVGTGLKLIQVFSKHKDTIKSIAWFVYFIKRKESSTNVNSFEFNSYLNWLKTYKFYNYENKICSKNKSSLSSISIISFVKEEDSKYLDNFVYCLENQSFKSFELLFCSSKKVKNKHFRKYKKIETTRNNEISALEKAIKSTTFEIILFIKPNVKVYSHSLSLVSSAFEDSKVVLCYGDEDKIGEDHFRCVPNFKTSFDSIRIINDNYIGNNIAVRKRFIPDFEPKYQGDEISFFHFIILKLNESFNEHIIHIPYILFGNYNTQDKFESIKNKYIESNNNFRVIENNGSYYFRPRLSNLNNPVSIIMPSACNLKYLKPCIQSIINITHFKNFEIVVVVNEIRFNDENIKQYLNEISNIDNISIVIYSNRKFNYSEIINFGVSKTTSEYICLMNDDMEVISPSWLEELLSWLSYDGVGIVGAKLLYPDNSLQHAGITIGLNGVCDHLEKNSSPSDYNANSRIAFPRCFSAVTAGCMVTTRKIFNSVNGFDENLPLTYNDVDFCLRVQDKGHVVVFSPFSMLYHHESVTVLKPSTLERRALFRNELIYFLTKHEKKIESDPHYSPNQSDTRPYFKLAFPPRLTKLGSKGIPLSWDQRQPIKKFAGSLKYSSTKVAIYSHYDIDNIVDSYVVKCLKELRNQDWIIIFVTSSNNLNSKETSKIEKFVSVILCSDGRGRDWGNFALGLKKASEWDFPKSLLLVNDSLYGPFTNLKKIFKSMDEMDADFLGLTDSYQHNYHLQSYFIYCKPSLCQNLVFINYWKKFIPQKEKDNIIYNNEIGFTKYFSNLGFIPKALFDYNKLVNTAKSGSYGASEQMGKLKEGTFVNPSHHFADLLITQYEFPFIKIELLRINPAKISGLNILMLFIKEKYPDHYALLADHLNRISKK